MINIKSLYYPKINSFIKDVNLSMNSGEVLGIAGQMASGKSLFLKAIANLPVSKFNFENKDFSKLLPNELISYCNSSVSVDSGLNLKEFLLTSLLYKKPFFSPHSPESIETVTYYAKHFDLSDVLSTPLTELSECQFQLALLAHAFSRGSKILLLDNPSKLLDIKSVSNLQREISRYSMHNDSIIMIAENNLSFLFQCCDKIAFINNGEILEILKPHDINSEKIKKYFTIDVIVSKNIINGKPIIQPLGES